MEDVASKPIHYEKKHEYTLVVFQCVKFFGKNAIKLFGTLLVYKVLIAFLVLVSVVKVSSKFQKVLILKGVILRYFSGELGENFITILQLPFAADCYHKKDMIE